MTGALAVHFSYMHAVLLRSHYASGQPGATIAEYRYIS